MGVVVELEQQEVGVEVEVVGWDKGLPVVVEPVVVVDTKTYQIIEP